jgi:hypothetical protein
MEVCIYNTGTEIQDCCWPVELHRYQLCKQVNGSVCKRK